MEGFIQTLIDQREYYIHLAILCGIYLILAQSFNLTFGLGRLLNLAHIAVYAIGAYTTALLSTELGLSPYVCIPASMLLAGLFALLIGAISLKLSQDYFAIGTLAFSAVVAALLINWKSLTRGVLGIPGIPRPEMLKVDFIQNYNFLILVCFLTGSVLIILWLLYKSSFSRSLRAQAEDEVLSLAVGKDTVKIRNACFVISSAFGGLAGSLFAYYINYIDPSSFSLTEMIFVLSIVIIGKSGSFWGVIAATFFLVLLPEPLRFLQIPPSAIGPVRQFLYAAILFVVVFIQRKNLFPLQRIV